MEISLDNWIKRDAIPFAMDADSFNPAVNRLVESLGKSVQMLGIGEPMHVLQGGEDFLILRNQLFQRLVAAHGFSAIAVESSCTRSPVVNAFVHGAGDATSFEAIQETGFSHNFGKLSANRALVEWMRQHNAQQSSLGRKLHFYGFDGPMEMTGTDSPRQAFHFALNYLTSVDGAGNDRRRRIDTLLGDDAAWENPAAMMDPSKSIGESDNAKALRVEAEELITELEIRRPELIARSSRDAYLEAAQHAAVARRLLTYHAGLARSSPNRIAELLGVRDALMADNLLYALERERNRGKVLAFAHNGHVRLGQMSWQLGPHALTWWPAGAHLKAILGDGYAVIGGAVGRSDKAGVGEPEAGTLEAKLSAAPGPARFIPTHRGGGISAAEIASLQTRSMSPANSTYFPLSPASFTDFDALVVL